MKIKKIFVTGFKSFMDRHEICFPEGLSAIVGPNGCGKSNIVDAIRWAMGEQSAKQLRGRQMEDVIFNGTDGHRPMGMAEVSLIFENGNGSFPPQFAHQSQMSVTRRLYRSGESEYLLNNVPCRLKDIQELFMDTGLGNRAYSIIGQGRISSIIEQKPEETRAMLEEAAGITKYKRKVEESQRKIELTRANLQRVEDILGEVERQMRSLKRQAAKARRFKTLNREIQDLEMLLNAHAYQALQEESGSKAKSTEDLVQEEIALSTKLSSVHAKIEHMNLELEEKDGGIGRLREVYLRHKDRVNRKESILESMAGEKRMQLELENRLSKEKGDLRRRLEDLGEERGGLLVKVEEVRGTYARMEEEITLAEKRVRSRQDLLKEIKEGYEEAKTKVHSGISKEMSLTQESGYLSKRIGEITDSRSRLEKEREEVTQKTAALVEASQRKGQVREALGVKLKEIEEEISREREKSEEFHRMRKQADTNLRSLEADLNICESRLATLRSMAENFEGYKIGVRTIMKAEDLDARREGRILGLVADMIQVDPRHEPAVEAVLGDKLQYVIVESHRDGKEAIEYLKSRAKGRSSFVPLLDLNGKQNGSGHNGFPLLRDQVSVPDSYRPLINVLLGDAAVVEDLGEAISAWAGNGRDQCLVTPEGDVIDPSGIISGGRLAHSSHGILARKREIQRLRERAVALRAERDALQEKLQGLDAELDKSGANLRGLEEEKAVCQEKINDLDKITFRFSHELDQLERLAERISKELEDRDKEQNRHAEALNRIETEIRSCQESRRQEEIYLREKETELRESEEEFEAFREELERTKMAYGLSKEEERGLLREIRRIEDFNQEGEETLARIEQDLSGAGARQQEIVTREEALRGEMGAFYRELELAEAAVNEAERERNQFRNEIREEENRAETVRAEVEALKETIHRARMEQSEIGFKMTSLVDSVREKFGLHLQDAYREYLREEFSYQETRDRLDHCKKLKERLGEVNLTAIQEHEALKERQGFITTQREDLLKSIESLNQAIRKINRTSLERFMSTFSDVDQKLKQVFPILFNGGTAGLRLLDETKPLETGVLVEVRPPGKKLSHMGLLSGGEKALVAMALLFAIYLIKPSPFCLLDEVDSPLDEANIDRFNDLLKEIRKYSQVILVTHNRRSMEIVDRLYGVTMEKQGVSKVVSVNLQGAEMN
ncbi:MAG: chromosome segregation protein SMC [Deltaproteobacteria bacterium]|nr:chromosome segregation protein SMC [Deltaproteobacteria bacterium]